MDAFSYSVSHDLRATLRSIGGFSKILSEEYAKELDNEGKSIIETIQTSTKQMGSLIDSLLLLSHLGHQEIIAADINMTNLVKRVFDELPTQIEKSNSHVISYQWLTLTLY